MRASVLFLFITIAAAFPAGAVDDPEPLGDRQEKRIVAIDPGHGGKDYGAVSNKVTEKELNLAISLLVGAELVKDHSLAFSLTRSSDVFVPLSTRVERTRKAGASAFVSIHADKAHKRGREGVILYCYGKNKLIPKGPPRAYGELLLPPPPQAAVAASRRLAGHIERALRAEKIKVGERDRGAFAVLKSPDIPSVLLEVGNLVNRGEARGVADERFQKKLAHAIAAGFKSYFAESASLPDKGR